jgi:hypothetical protein
MSYSGNFLTNGKCLRAHCTRNHEIRKPVRRNSPFSTDFQQPFRDNISHSCAWQLVSGNPIPMSRDACFNEAKLLLAPCDSATNKKVNSAESGVLGHYVTKFLGSHINAVYLGRVITPMWIESGFV